MKRLQILYEVKEFDIVALQEILSEGYALEYMIKFYLPGWDFRCEIPSDSTDPQKARDNRGEGYAFYGIQKD